MPVVRCTEHSGEFVYINSDQVQLIVESHIEGTIIYFSGREITVKELPEDVAAAMSCVPIRVTSI